MIRSLTLTLIITVLLAACTPATALPTEIPTSTPLPTATATAIPTPTHTPTPTLEPWMQALPKDIASVEVDGNDIFGLDRFGNRTMAFDLKSGAWKDLVMEFDSATEAMSYYAEKYVDKFGTSSYAELRDGKLQKDPSVRERRNYQYPELPYSLSTEQGYVFGVELVHLPFMDPDVNYAMVLTGFSGVNEHPVMVLCGVDDRGTYKPICTHIEDSGKKLSTLKELRTSLVGKVHIFELVEYTTRPPWNYSQYYDKLSHPEDHKDDAQYMLFYKQQIEMRGDNLELFGSLVYEDGSPARQMLTFDTKLFPSELRTTVEMGISGRYEHLFNALNLEKRYMIPSVILR